MYAYVAGIKKNPDDKTSHFVCSHCAISFIGNDAVIGGVYISSFTDTIIIYKNIYFYIFYLKINIFKKTFLFRIFYSNMYTKLIHTFIDQNTSVSQK